MRPEPFVERVRDDGRLEQRYRRNVAAELEQGGDVPLEHRGSHRFDRCDGPIGPLRAHELEEGRAAEQRERFGADAGPLVRVGEGCELACDPLERARSSSSGSASSSTYPPGRLMISAVLKTRRNCEM